jgi:hypothetical protein
MLADFDFFDCMSKYGAFGGGELSEWRINRI